MGKLHIDELRPGMRLQSDVFGMRNRKLFPAGTVLEDRQITAMKAWGVTEAEIEGVTRKDLADQPGPEIPPQILEAARGVVDDCFRGTHAGNEFMEEFHRLCVLRTALRIQQGTFSPMLSSQLDDLRIQCAERDAERRPESARMLVATEVKLLSFPHVYTHILREMQSPACSARRLGEIVSRDTGLTAKILRLVNSPFYGFPARIDTVERAITILGANELTTLALGISAVTIFGSVPSGVLNMRHFWEHSVSCGVLARLIAGHIPGLSEERFFVGGLLHDIGMLLMLRCTPKAQCCALLHSRDNKVPLEEAERHVYGFDHAEVGGLLLKAWSIPQTLAHMVRNHHSPQKNQPLLDAAIIHLADMLALGLRSDDYSAFYAPQISQQVLEAVGLPPSALEPMLIQHHRQMSEMMHVFFGGA